MRVGGRTDKYTAPAGWKTKQRGLKKDSKTDEVGDEDYRIETQVSWETVWGYSKDGREVALTFRWGLTSPRAPIWHSSACKTWGEKNKKGDREKFEKRQQEVFRKSIKPFALSSVYFMSDRRNNKQILKKNWELKKLISDSEYEGGKQDSVNNWRVLFFSSKGCSYLGILVCRGALISRCFVCIYRAL